MSDEKAWSVKASGLFVFGVTGIMFRVTKTMFPSDQNHVLGHKDNFSGHQNSIEILWIATETQRNPIAFLHTSIGDA